MTKIALTIAGVDPSGGAGTLADVKTFAAFGVFPTAAIASITFQNTQGVFGAEHQSSESVRQQIIPILDDYDVAAVKTLLERLEGVEQVLDEDGKRAFGLDHPRSGELVAISQADRWFSYYYWLNDARAPDFARTVDIHRKPGYDPVELHMDFATKSIPLDATLIKGSHGAPPHDDDQRGVLLSSQPGVFSASPTADIDVCTIVLRQFGI